MLHFASKVVTVRVDVTFCVKNCYSSGLCSDGGATLKVGGGRGE